jgi:ribose transport system ATP-binding protein
MLDASVADNMALCALTQFASPRLGLVRRAELLQAERSLLPLLNLKSGPIDTTPVRTLSGGNQQKVVLARWLLNPPRLLILDESTRGIDVGAKQDIYRLLVKLVEQGVGILLVSSELEELLGLCDRILVLHRGRLNGEFPHDRFDRHALLGAAFGQSAAV